MVSLQADGPPMKETESQDRGKKENRNKNNNNQPPKEKIFMKRKACISSRGSCLTGDYERGMASHGSEITQCHRKQSYPPYIS